MNFKKFFIFMFCFLTTCSSPFSHHYVDYYELKGVKKVAVFPFSNLSTNPWAREIVTQIFIAELAKKDLFVIEDLGNIIDFMVEQRIKIGSSLDRARLLLLKRRYKIDAVIFGKILTFEEKGGIPYLNFSVRMVSTEDAEVLWKASIEKSGEDYVRFLNISRVRTLPQLTQRVVDELIETIKIKEIPYAVAKKERIKRRVSRTKKRLTKLKPTVIRHSLQSAKKKIKKISKRFEKRFTMLAAQKPFFFKKRKTKAIDPCKGEKKIQIRFDFDSAFLDPAYYSELEKVGRCLKKYPWERAIIAGHTDNVGSEIYNIRLSLRRAEIIKDFFLKRFNLSPYQTVIIGYGERYPIADNATVDGRAKNRRVEITVRIK
ncbi:MAG TPA: hypothetical protein ENG63_02400 [Candidatus Desulfofervidus auxilii]|uniref:OmpA-like domain-containing protein n=1 Tax=Desulfofervidus auxilii TaxID=1621989 RepID=A0A7C0U1U3_DESA2|nr:hypothetical protein [Candidatus Desulfofervidus auxilii]